MESFPVEVILSILEHLPQSDLVKATEVCKKFRETIEKFNLIKRIFICDSPQPPNRKYSEAIVKRYEPDVHQKVFEATGNHLKMLKFAHCTLNLVDILKVLQLATNVEALSFSYVRLDDDRLDSAAELPQLKNVNLLFEESNPEIFNVFKKSSFTKIDLRFFADVPYSNFAPLVNLLQTQEKLSSIAFSGIYESNLFLIPMGKALYRLKEFLIDNCDFEEWDGLESYLAEHTETLEKFTVGNLRWDSSTTLNHCTKLKSLHAYRTELNFLGQLPSVEELSLEMPMRTIDNFPNVKKLFLAKSTVGDNQVVSTSMQKLVELEVKLGAIEGISVPTLRKLKISIVSGVISNDFFILHNKIENLTFEYCFNIDDALLEAIASNLNNLKVLRILGDNHLTSRAFAIIKENCKNLKVFEMTKWDQKFKKEDWQCLSEMTGLQVYTEKF